jgi:hypothetical protein
MKYNKEMPHGEKLISFQNLMCELIFTAERDLGLDKNSWEYQRAYQWFNQNGLSNHSCSFENACLIIGSDPDYLRIRIFDKYKIS